MNGNFNIGSKKFAIILMLIIVCFMLLLIHAFDYLPETSGVSDDFSPIETRHKVVFNNEQENEMKDIQSNASETNEEATEETKQEKKSLNINLKSDVSKELKLIDETVPEELSEIKEVEVDEPPKVPALTAFEELELKFLKARNYKKEKQYSNALKELQAIESQAVNYEQKARCYEEIANLYAITKRYGSALSYAQKAYNLSPTSSRETLLARLYYKTGEIDKATRRINNVLQRDFVNE